jgi:hypothetical protein
MSSLIDLTTTTTCLSQRQPSLGPLQRMLDTYSSLMVDREATRSGSVILRTDAAATTATLIWSAAMSLAARTMTNNQAEYVGLLTGLQAALHTGPASALDALIAQTWDQTAARAHTSSGSARKPNSYGETFSRSGKPSGQQVSCHHSPDACVCHLDGSDVTRGPVHHQQPS